MKGKIGAIILGIVMVFCLIACIVCLEKNPRRLCRRRVQHERRR